MATRSDRVVSSPRMKLNVARLCVDCEEVHDAQRCPVCASESFAYLIRWVPAESRAPVPPTASPIVTPTRLKRVVFGGGVIGVLTFALMRWAKRRVDVASFRKVGELR
jgi:hypothetical protein